MSERKTPVRLYVGGLTGRVWAATRYTEKDGRLMVSVKHDVTEDFYAAVFEFLERHTLRDDQGREVVIVERAAS